MELIPRISESIHRHGVPVTWFVRADQQIRDVYGHAAYLLERHAPLWKQLKSQGDEIGWHPHVYSRSGGNGLYRAEYDEKWLASELRETYAQLTTRGYEFCSVRVGEAIGGNAIIEGLAEAGLQVDSSAIPGRRRSDGSRTFDWFPTPNFPYWPSKSDYRVPGKVALPILEVPMTTVTVRAPYDTVPRVRYVNLAYRPHIFVGAVERWLDSLGGSGSQAVLTLIMHPDELLPARQDHPLFEHTPTTLEKNFNAVLAGARRRAIDWTGATTSSLVQQYTGTMAV
jgi:hypothetical protein